MFIQRKTELKWYIAWKQTSSAEHVCSRAMRHFTFVFLCINIFCHTYIALYIFLYIFWYITMSNYVYIKNNRPNMICFWVTNAIRSGIVWRHNKTADQMIRVNKGNYYVTKNIFRILLQSWNMLKRRGFFR